MTRRSIGEACARDFIARAVARVVVRDGMFTPADLDYDVVMLMDPVDLRRFVINADEYRHALKMRASLLATVASADAPPS